eukprot:TRINITY_DN8037_c0_g1_i1.p1 TRINITY_DN8037_c0_g1~~TRINITY_DN8037_c0_g1_i1.p1  ORF type:complete len:459 (-),score=139.39 TRINITY_DN8037_c0_g1_i1:545-1921(-)
MQEMHKIFGEKKSFKERAKHIKKIKQFLLENIDEAIEVIYTSNGKTRFDAIGTEVLPCIMSIDYYTSSEARKILESRSIGPGHIMFANKRNFIEYLPVGVVGIISPWNYPFSIPFGEVIMGLVAGNAIILKVAKECVIIGEFIERCIAAAGLPEGLFYHLVARGSAAAKLMFDNGIDKLFFTGSVNVGKILMKQAADTLTPLSLELGGKDPMIVLEDANIERATNCACWAGYQNAGQSCGGIERVYVAASIYDEFVDLLAKKTKALRHGVDNDENDFNVDIGSITTQSQYNLIEEHVNEAVEEGAEIIAQSQSVGNIDGGLFYPATLLVNVSHDMRVIREETFGPVVPVMKFDTIEEAIELANDSDFALTCSVWTENTKLGKKIAREVQSGAACVNDHLYTHGMANTPWGGPKLSGLGRTHVLYKIYIFNDSIIKYRKIRFSLNLKYIFLFLNRVNLD